MRREGKCGPGAAPPSVCAEMESSQAVQAISTSVIMAPLQSLMPSDNGAGAQTALGCCGSPPAPGIMALVHPQDRMFTLTGRRVSPCERIDTSVTLSRLLRSPAQTSHPQLSDTVAFPKSQFDQCDTKQLIIVVVVVLGPK